MREDSHEARLFEICINYRSAALRELRERWTAWPVDPTQNEKHEVIGGLLARQTTLAVELVAGPPMWTPHVAPLVLRSMVDLRITFGWILLDALARSRDFVLFGLGQVKLRMEHMKADVAKSGGDPESNPIVGFTQRWIDAQRFHFLTEVNIGNWARTDLRKMAIACGCEELYRSDYAAWSAGTHSMWHHIQPHNLSPCSNPLHRGGHRVPDVPEFPNDLSYPLFSAKYLAETFDAFDRFRGLDPPCASAFELLESELAKFGDEIDPKHPAAERASSDASAPGPPPTTGSES